jgi:predicted RNA-binding Zn-ribbon protein involved in translation (DUF1610 family)
MSEPTMDQLDLLFRELVRVLRDSRAEYLARPFDVAELIAYVPYRAVRSAISADSNDDYAHAVTRLLAGERGYLFADELLQDDLKAELASPNPNLGAYRSYLNARVTLSQEHTRQALESLSPPPVAEASNELSVLGALLESAAAPQSAPIAAPVDAVPPSATFAREMPHAPPPAPPHAPPPAPPRPHTESRTPDARAPDAPRRASRPGCKYCGQSLPDGRDAQFCPHCGQNLLMRRCAACSSELEAGWKFCITCGRAAP